MSIIWKRINDTGKNWRHVYKVVYNLLILQLSANLLNCYFINMQGLTVLEYLVAHGSEKVIDEIREHSYQIAVRTILFLLHFLSLLDWCPECMTLLQFSFQTLSEFQYLSSSGRDEGSNVRKKSQNLVALVNDKERIQEVRQKAHANRDK